MMLMQSPWTSQEINHVWRPAKNVDLVLREGDDREKLLKQLHCRSGFVEGHPPSFLRIPEREVRVVGRHISDKLVDFSRERQSAICRLNKQIGEIVRVFQFSAELSALFYNGLQGILYAEANKEVEREADLLNGGGLIGRYNAFRAIQQSDGPG
ncbi:hypothetical protein [Bradyrhizobium sp. AC87j1]|uniref:hypothetical protein n=1 Tax=Bradyrhizobium sp. AC87j1 TaxID=2055894 RepID=UPI0011AFD57B|nr:hypothetical protein [Bradyrhizobium sp. AC87j1]